RNGDRVRGDRGSRAPPRAGDRGEDAVLQPEPQDGDADVLKQPQSTQSSPRYPDSAFSAVSAVAFMRIALVQQHATPDKASNVARGLRAFDEAARAGASLVCFAELAFEPFYPQNPAGPRSRAAAEPVPGPLTDAFAARARELGVVAVLNLFERDGDRTFDCSPVIDADGALLGRTRMVHITEYACFHEQG